jgi:hypothetical protein
MYPSLVNCTTIDMFADWPQDALLEVGERYLSQIELAGDDKVNNLEIKFSFNLIYPNKHFQFPTVRRWLLFYLHLSLLSFNDFCPFACNFFFHLFEFILLIKVNLLMKFFVLLKIVSSGNCTNICNSS